jgi:hypothetical protein
LAVTVHDVTITHAENGAPLRAECSCGWTWLRPDGDRWADTLPPAARAHRLAAVERDGCAT